MVYLQSTGLLGVRVPCHFACRGRGMRVVAAQEVGFMFEALRSMSGREVLGCALEKCNK